jgi:hypothetical protein
MHRFQIKILIGKKERKKNPIYIKWECFEETERVCEVIQQSF